MTFDPPFPSFILPDFITEEENDEMTRLFNEDTPQGATVSHKRTTQTSIRNNKTIYFNKEPYLSNKVITGVHNRIRAKLTETDPRHTYYGSSHSEGGQVQIYGQEQFYLPHHDAWTPQEICCKGGIPAQRTWSCVLYLRDHPSGTRFPHIQSTIPSVRNQLACWYNIDYETGKTLPLTLHEGVKTPKDIDKEKVIITFWFRDPGYNKLFCHNTTASWVWVLVFVSLGLVILSCLVVVTKAK